MRTTHSLLYREVSVQGGLHPRGMGVSVKEISPPKEHGISDRDPLPLKEHGTRDRDPPEGTWDQAARQEVISYRAPSPLWTE